MIFGRIFLMRLANDLAVILKSQLKREMGFQFFRGLAGLFVLGTTVISPLFCVIDKYPSVGVLIKSRNLKYP